MRCNINISVSLLILNKVLFFSNTSLIDSASSINLFIYAFQWSHGFKINVVYLLIFFGFYEVTFLWLSLSYSHTISLIILILLVFSSILWWFYKYIVVILIASFTYNRPFCSWCSYSLLFNIHLLDSFLNTK